MCDSFDGIVETLFLFLILINSHFNAISSSHSSIISITSLDLFLSPLFSVRVRTDSSCSNCWLVSVCLSHAYALSYSYLAFELTIFINYIIASSGTSQSKDYLIWTQRYYKQNYTDFLGFGSVDSPFVNTTPKISLCSLYLYYCLAYYNFSWIHLLTYVIVL